MGASSQVSAITSILLCSQFLLPAKYAILFPVLPLYNTGCPIHIEIPTSASCNLM